MFFVEENQTASRYCAEFFLHPLTVRPVGFEGSPVGFEGDRFIRAEDGVLRRREIDRERVNESAEEREARLSRRRLRDRERPRQRLVTEIAEEREERLARGRQRARERLATETADEREARLAKRRARRAAESE